MDDAGANLVFRTCTPDVDGFRHCVEEICGLTSFLLDISEDSVTEVFLPVVISEDTCPEVVFLPSAHDEMGLTADSSGFLLRIVGT